VEPFQSIDFIRISIDGAEGDRDHPPKPEEPLMLMRVLVLALLFLTPVAAQTRESWQIGHGPFVTASDVTAHNKFPQDMADIRALLSGEKPDWAGALALYAYGKHFKAHSVGRFADNYNGRLDVYLPAAAKHFGSASFQNAFLFSALAHTGRFARASEVERKAAIDAGMSALLINYARYELGEAERKAKDAKPNWSLQNGAPKNWNEVFAFYYGPDGKHGAFEAVAKLPNGEKLNARILNALAKGQPDLVAGKWAPEAAAELTAALDTASIALFRDALVKLVAASPGQVIIETPKDQPLPEFDREAKIAQARAQGFWLAAVDAVMRLDAKRGAIIEIALLAATNSPAAKIAIELLPNAPGE
jgi:hypothetical protein